LSIKKTKLSDFSYKLPPTPRVGLVMAEGPHRPALILLFRERKFFFALPVAGVVDPGRRDQPIAATERMR